MARTSDEGSRRLSRRLVDVAMLAYGVSGLGPCLRRSLLRYHFLRRSGFPVTINFGARVVAGKPDQAVAGHAWPGRKAGAGNWYCQANAL